ncbi:MAG: hypothetical protein AAF907_07585 [Planctomycetota bacterium]
MPHVALLAVACFAAVLPEDEEPPALPPLTDADRAAIAAVEELGGQVVQLAEKDFRLDVSFHLGKVELTPQHLDALVPLASRLRELNLRGTNFDDKLSRKLTLLPNLTRLHLEKTQITDAALVPVSTLEKLTYLNLYGTAVSDAGLPKLAGLPELESLYLWQTKATAEGVLELRKSLPETEFVGIELPKPPKEPVEAPKPESAEETEDDPKKETE